MFCLHHSGLLFVFLHSPRVREEATTLISLPCKTPFLLPTTGSVYSEAVCIDLLHGLTLALTRDGLWILISTTIATYRSLHI